MQKPVIFFWFRRDLRLYDNAGLFHALKSGLPVQCVFIFDTNILNQLDEKRDARLVFIHEQLEKLNGELQKQGSSLLTIYDTPLNGWKKLAESYSIQTVFTNKDYEPYAIKRDTEINDFLESKKIKFHSYKDHVIFENQEIVKDDGKPYTVFTPYKNKYLATLKPENYKPYNIPEGKNNFNRIPPVQIHSLKQIGFEKTENHFPDKLVSDNLLKNYANTRNFPAIAGTSRLSVHLRFGTISIRELFSRAIRSKSDLWLSELIWREFYQMILSNFPYITKSAFKPLYDTIRWRNNENEFKKWCEGKTGYPIVDAGMNELNTTGFMHNRVRMITASFLVKHLLIDWRWGEAYFAKKLIDYDLAANNGGWQWASGSGCDAAPYFRIFNPYEQTRKFDPDLKYIRKWVPDFEELTYPQPLVEHKFARERCLKVYGEMAERKK